MKTSRSMLLLSLVVMTATFALAPMAIANQWTAVPELEPRESVAIQRGYDGSRHDAARECFKGANSLIGANYYGALVAITDPSGARGTDLNDGNEYAQFLSRQWAEEGRVDEERDIVIVVGFTNRSIGVHLGERWQGLGLTDEVFQEMIVASQARNFIGRRAYANAMCRVLSAIDHRLAFLVEEKDRNLEAAQEVLPPAEERLGAVAARISETLPDDHEVGTDLTAQLAAAQALLETGDIIEEAPTEVIAAAEAIHRISDDVEAQLERYLTLIAPLDELEERIEAAIAAVASRDDKDWDGPVAADQILQQCQQSASQARLVENPDLLEIQDCLHRAEVELAQSDVRHYFLARAIPKGVLAIVILLALIYLAARVLRRRRALLVLGPDLSTWETGLDQAGKKLARLKAEFPWYFGQRSEFWQGESAARDRAISDGINRAFLLHKKGLELLEKARALRGRSKLLNVGKLEKAQRILRKTKVAFDAGTSEADRPLLLPLTTPFESKASELVNDLDAAFFAAHDGLVESAPVQQEIADLTAAADEAYRAAAGEIEKRQSRKLPVHHLQQSLDEAGQNFQSALQSANATPEEGARALEVALEALEAVRAQGDGGNWALDVVEGQVAELRRQIDALLESASRKGIIFGDSGFEPDTVVELANEKSALVVDLVASGREGEALNLLEPLIEALESTVLRLSVCIEAAGVLPTLISSIESVQDQVKEPLFRIRMRLQRLDDDVDQDSVADHVDEISRLQKILPRLDRLIKGIVDAHEGGKTLRAVSDLTSLVEALDMGATSLAELERFIEASTSDGPPPAPADPLWQPPESWRQNPASTWGNSEDGFSFRSLSLPESAASSNAGKPLSSLV